MGKSKRLRRKVLLAVVEAASSGASYLFLPRRLQRAYRDLLEHLDLVGVPTYTKKFRRKWVGKCKG